MRSSIGNSASDPFFVTTATQTGTDSSGQPTYSSTSSATRETVDLVSNSSVAATSPTKTLYGGDYAYSITGTMNGASVQLQTQDRNGTTYTNFLAARTANDGAGTPPGSTLATFGGNSIVRAVVTGGPPTSLYVSLSRIPS